MTERRWFTSQCPRDMLRAFYGKWGSRQKRMISLGAFLLVPTEMLNPPTREWLSLAEQIVEEQTVDLRSSILYHRLRECWSDTQTGQVTYAMCQHVVSESVESLVWCAMMLRNGYQWQLDGLIDGKLARLIRDVVGNPFHSVTFSTEWQTSTAVAIARGMYESRDFSPMPILADALQDAGCDNDDILNHSRDPQGVHVRGCWVVDHVLGKS